MQMQIQVVVCGVVRLEQTGPVAISSNRQPRRMFSQALQTQISQTQARSVKRRRGTRRRVESDRKQADADADADAEAEAGGGVRCSGVGADRQPRRMSS
jgi:hypothetical protein